MVYRLCFVYDVYIVYNEHIAYNVHFVFNLPVARSVCLICNAYNVYIVHLVHIVYAADTVSFTEYLATELAQRHLDRPAPIRFAFVHAVEII